MFLIKNSSLSGRENEAVFVSGAKGKPPTDTYKVSYH